MNHANPFIRVLAGGKDWKVDDLAFQQDSGDHKEQSKRISDRILCDRLRGASTAIWASFSDYHEIVEYKSSPLGIRHAAGIKFDEGGRSCQAAIETSFVRDIFCV